MQINYPSPNYDIPTRHSRRKDGGFAAKETGYAGRHNLAGFPLRSIYSSSPPSAEMTKQERRE